MAIKLISNNPLFFYKMPIAFLLLMNIYLVYSRVLNPTKEEKQYSVTELRYFDIFKKNLLSSFKNSSIRLNNAKVYYGNQTADSIELFKLINDKALVFRFSGEYCEDCITSVLKSLKRNFPDYETNKRIILLCSETNVRVKEKYYGKRLLSFTSGDLGLPIEKSKIPVLFVVDKSQLSQMIFIPDPSDPTLTEKYISIVKSKINN